MGLFDIFFGKGKNKANHHKSGNIDISKLSKFTLIDLCEPLFTVVQPFELKQDSPIQEIAKNMERDDISLSDLPRGYLERINRLNKEYPKDPHPYYWLIDYYFHRAEYDDAKNVVYSGLLNVENKAHLAHLMGQLMELKKNPIALGWWMQACLLASSDFLSYLNCAQITLHLNEIELHWRLLNAVDILSPSLGSMPRLKEHSLQELCQKVNINELRLAVKKFSGHMNQYLPEMHDIPQDNMKRSIFTSIGEFEKYRKNALKALLREKPFKEKKLTSNLSGLAQKLISDNHEQRNSAINLAREYAISGNRQGLEAMEEAIRYMYEGENEIEFHTPGFLATNFSAMENSPEKIKKIAKEKRLWKISPREFQILFSNAITLVDGKNILNEITELGDASQILAFQLLGMHFIIQSELIEQTQT